MAMRYNPPPGWPPAPAGWTPPPGWQPDPSWGPPPAGWPLWVDDQPTVAPPGTPVGKDSTAFAWGLGGGGAVILGSVMPFITPKIEGLYEVEPSARTTSVIFGAILLGLGFGMKPVGSRMACSIILLIASALGTLGYLSFMAAGLAGFEDESEFGFGQTIEFSPNIGLIACIAGCIVAFVASILGLRDRPKPTFAYGHGGYGGYGQGYGAPGAYGGPPGPYGGGPGLPPAPGGGGSGYTF